MAADATNCQFTRESSTVAAPLRCTVGPNRLSSTRRKSTECRGWQQGYPPRSRRKARFARYRSKRSSVDARASRAETAMGLFDPTAPSASTMA